MQSDRELIELANKGDPEAFEALYHRYRDWAYRLAFIYLLGKFPGFELTAAMTTFLYPVVRHLAVAVRSRNRRFTSDEEVLSELAAPVLQETEHDRSELAAVLKILPEAQREILLMRFADSMSLLEIAAALDIPLGTVKSRLHNALKTLRNDRRTRDYFLE